MPMDVQHTTNSGWVHHHHHSSRRTDADAANVNSESTLMTELSVLSLNSLEILGPSHPNIVLKEHLHFLLDVFGVYYSRLISEERLFRI